MIVRAAGRIRLRLTVVVRVFPVFGDRPCGIVQVPELLEGNQVFLGVIRTAKIVEQRWVSKGVRLSQPNACSVDFQKE